LFFSFFFYAAECLSEVDASFTAGIRSNQLLELPPNFQASGEVSV